MKTEYGALEHAWRYFQLHANQRVAVFNYFVVFSGLLVTGMVAAGQASPRYDFVGAILGLLLCVLSYVFYKLDERVSFLIKNSEEAIKKLEPTNAALFTDEVNHTFAARRKGMWTYGQAFRRMFLIMGLVGIAGTVVSGYRGFAEPSAPKIFEEKENVDRG